MSLFLVYPKDCHPQESEYLLVAADSIEEVKIKHKNYCIENDHMFLSYCYIGCVNDGLAENFWLPDDAAIQRFEKNPDDIISYDTFKENVRRFFKNNSSYAELFISNYETYIDKNYPDFYDFCPSRHLKFPYHMLEILWDAFEFSKWENNYSCLRLDELIKI